MKSRCRQSLLFVAFFLLSLTVVNAAEVELKAQHQLDQDTWVTTYEVLEWNTLKADIDDFSENSRNVNSSKYTVPKSLENLINYLEGLESVSRARLDYSTGLITIVSSKKLELPEKLNK